MNQLPKLQIEYEIQQQIIPSVQKLSSVSLIELEEPSIVKDILIGNRHNLHNLFDEYDNSKEIQDFCLQINDNVLKQYSNLQMSIEIYFINNPKYLVYEEHQKNPIIKYYTTKYFDGSLNNTYFKMKLDESLVSLLVTDDNQHNIDKSTMYVQYLDEKIHNISQHYYHNESLDATQYNIFKQIFDGYVFNNTEALVKLINKYDIFLKTNLLDDLLQNEAVLKKLIITCDLSIASILRLKAKSQIETILPNLTFNYKIIARDLVGVSNIYDTYKFVIKNINYGKPGDQELYQIKYDSVYNQEKIIAIVLGNNVKKKQKLLGILDLFKSPSTGFTDLMKDLNYTHPYLHYLFQNPNFIQTLMVNPTVIADSKKFKEIINDNTRFLINPHFGYFSPELELLLKKLTTMETEVFILGTFAPLTFKNFLRAGIVGSPSTMLKVGKDTIDKRFFSLIEQFYAKINFKAFGAADKDLILSQLQEFTSTKYRTDDEYFHNCSQLNQFMLTNCQGKEDQLINFLISDVEALKNLGQHTYIYNVKFVNLFQNKASLQTLIEINPTETYLFLEEVKNLNLENKNIILQNSQEIVFAVENDYLLLKTPENLRNYVAISNIFQMFLDDLYQKNKDQLGAFILTATEKQKEQINIFFAMHPTYDIK